MAELVEFGKWYEQKGLHYLFDEFGSGTNAVVRGNLNGLVNFVHQLDLTYRKSGSYTLSKIEEILNGVLLTGEAKTREVICFSNDRIRLIRRLDDENFGRYQNGSLSGSQEHLEVTHNEQYGGKYPGNPLLSSRAAMIEKGQTALENI